MTTIETGTISHGTLRDEDLIPTFLGVLDAHAPERAVKIREEYGQGFIDRCIDPSGLEYPTIGEIDRRGWLVEDLFLALEDIAPPGTYFGAIEGDASDFGFWAYDED